MQKPIQAARAKIGPLHGDIIQVEKCRDACLDLRKAVGSLSDYLRYLESSFLAQ